jgi:hypothetical protein
MHVERSVAFAERSQHLYRQRLEPALTIGTFFAEHGLGGSTPTGGLPGSGKGGAPTGSIGDNRSDGPLSGASW